MFRLPWTRFQSIGSLAKNVNSLKIERLKKCHCAQAPESWHENITGQRKIIQWTFMSKRTFKINVTFYNEETKKRQNSFTPPNSFVNFQWELISISIAFQNYFSYGVFSLFNPQPWAMIFSFQILLLQSHAFTCLCNIQTFESKQKCFSIFLSEHNCSVGQS